MPFFSPIAIYVSTFVCCATALLLNVTFVVVYVKRKPKDKKQFAVLLLVLVSHTLFDISCGTYTCYILASLYCDSWNLSMVFWSGNVFFSLMLTIIVGNCFMAIDRILAMRHPVLYNSKYSTYCQRVCVAFMAVSFLASFISVYMSMEAEPLSSPPAFNNMVNPVVLNDLSLVRTVCSMVNFVLTIFFLMEAKRFLKTQNNGHVTRSIRKTNQVVLCQVVAETFILVLPDLVTQSFNWKIKRIRRRLTLSRMFNFCHGRMGVGSGGGIGRSFG
ncbi:hypothetical protein QR680_010094 [Steinernema hermaphroditum]|uniref:G-protein coupled receptors family 1 profile domain-containing protein n=1 Tax=Steinernema hermaphroditum TaxID=289476 RepID=A0AA39MB51_9BILA|nr:hypothetical protein QR680_010094 [Steinernema hermaphroditum]